MPDKPAISPLLETNAKPVHAATLRSMGLGMKLNPTLKRHCLDVGILESLQRDIPMIISTHPRTQ